MAGQDLRLVVAEGGDLSRGGLQEQVAAKVRAFLGQVNDGHWADDVVATADQAALGARGTCLTSDETNHLIDLMWEEDDNWQDRVVGYVISLIPQDT